MSLHPVIRIICFLILVLFLARMRLPEMLLLTFLFFLFAMHNFRQHMIVLWHFIWRLKWFWLSILLLSSLMPIGTSDYAFKTDEQIYAGFIEGIIRCLALLLVIMYFVLLVNIIHLEQLQRAWYWLMRPCKIIRLNPELISVRIALRFHAVRELQASSAQPVQKIKLHQLPDRLFAFMQMAVEKSAVQSFNSPQSELLLTSPSIRQWIIPITLIVALSILTHFKSLHLLPAF